MASAGKTRASNAIVGAVTLMIVACAVLIIALAVRTEESDDAKFDIFFRQLVSGLVRGAGVTFHGVPVGNVKLISLWNQDPNLVRVRIAIKPDTPVTRATFAYLTGVGLTGTSSLSLEGAERGAPPLSCAENTPDPKCPRGVPVIPARAGGLSAIINSAPQLAERFAEVSSRVSRLVDKRNSGSVSQISSNLERLTDSFTDHGQSIEAVRLESRPAMANFAQASRSIKALAATTRNVITGEVKPAARNLRETVKSAQHLKNSADRFAEELRPAERGVSRTLIPETRALVTEAKATVATTGKVTDRARNEGSLAIIAPRRVPEYNATN